MMLGKKFSVACISLLMVLALAGCGKTGESEAEKLVKEACKIPDSYKKIDYQVDDKNGISYLDFKAKNMLGMEVPGRAYFKITKDRIIGIDTDDIERNVLDDFYKNAPTEFSECVKSYKILKKNHYKENFDLEFFLERYKDLKYEKDNFYAWQSVAKKSIKANDIIKKYNDAYKTAPQIVKKYFPEPMQYFKINLTGSSRGGWRANAERTDEYPEQ